MTFTRTLLSFAMLMVCLLVGPGFGWERNLPAVGTAGSVLLVKSTADSAAAGCSGSVSITPPASDLAAIVSNSPAGTCFVLADGTYRFSDVVPKDGMAFLGASTEGVIVDGRGRENAFHGTADRVTIGRMTFQDFDSSAGTSRQEQSPIRGTARIWASDRGQMATNWTIDSVVSQRNHAAGIFVGDHFTVRNSIFRNNGVTGMSGDSFVGGLFENNIVHDNGAYQQTGVAVNGGGMKFGQAGTPQAPVVIRNNEVYRNPNIGIWCDIGCEGFHVIGNYVHDHVSRGIMYELSSNLVVRDNTVVRSNTWTNFLGDFNAGAITVGESRNALIENNRIEEAKAGVVVRQTKRPAGGEGFLANYPTVNYLTSDVIVRNNVHVAVQSTGVSTGTTGVGLMPAPGSISYEGNTYDDAAGMTFWWVDGQRQTAAQWREAGRDTSASGSAPQSATDARGPSGVPAPVLPAPSPEPPSTPLSTPSGVSETADVPLRINAGGPAMVDARGMGWLEDEFYVGGWTASHAEGVAIRNTSTDDLYRDERWGAVGYDIPLPRGDYRIRLHHAEVFEGCQVASCRQFSVDVEGRTVLADIDLFEEVGGYSALVVESVHTVDDGMLTIRFAASRQNAQVSGIEVLPIPGQPDVAASQASPTPSSSANTTAADSPESKDTGSDDANAARDEKTDEALGDMFIPTSEETSQDLALVPDALALIDESSAVPANPTSSTAVADEPGRVLHGPIGSIVAGGTLALDYATTADDARPWTLFLVGTVFWASAVAMRRRYH